jgi:hypothetical protein
MGPMIDEPEAMLAACGLDCRSCDIRQAPSDPELAEGIARWFREHVDTKAEPSWFHCSGCLGDRADHWSPDCWILLCCVDDKGLLTCAQCEVFPFGRLVEWSTQSKKYTQSLNRLREASAATKAIPPHGDAQA